MNFVRHEATITLKSPTIIGAGAARGNSRDTLGWLPGTTLLGALAGQALRNAEPGTSPDQDFIDTFQHGRFGPAFSQGDVREAMSVVRCKYQTAPECAAESVDLAWTTSNETLLRCPSCDRPMEMAKGALMELPAARRDKEELGDTRRRLQRSSTSLTPAETAKDGNLFRREALTRLTELNGTVWLPKARTDTVRVRLGGSKSTHGAATVEFTPAGSPQLNEQTLARLNDTGELIVRLESPAILVDNWGIPALSPHEWQWELDAAFPDLGAKVTAAWMRWDTEGGWTSSGLPKPTETVASAGSVFVVEFQAKPSAEQVLAFRDNGLGLRTGHGFGWISLDPTTPAQYELPTEEVELDGDETPEQTLIDLSRQSPGLRTKIVGLLRLLAERERFGHSPSVVATVMTRSWAKGLPLDQQTRLIRGLDELEPHQRGIVIQKLQDLPHAGGTA